jgi:hypothetical protein
MNIDKEDLFKYYKNCLKYMVSSDDFGRWLPDCKNKILKYSDLKNYKTIEDLLPENIDYKIILTEWKSNQGHWTCILRYGNIIEWFDSLSGQPDSELKYVPKIISRFLGEDKKILTKLIDTSKNFTVIYNKKKLQKNIQGIDTCGRWILSRVLGLVLKHQDLVQYLNFIEKIHKSSNKPLDIIVCDLVPMPNPI